MPDISWLIPNLSQTEWLIHAVALLVNLSLFLLAKPILGLIDSGVDQDKRVKVFQTLNILVLILHAIDLIFLRASNSYENYFIRVGLSLMMIYAGLFIQTFGNYLSRRRFGTEKIFDDNSIFVDSYSSRLVDIIFLTIVVVTVIYALIKIWGADSMLETTGIFGILAAFLAFTSNIWAPDIISGLIILNTQVLEDGDVVVVDGYPDEYIISKVTLIYVILYDIRNNHRTLIRNSQFTQSKIDNLSRVASTDGIRQSLTYNIGYPSFDTVDEEQRQKQLLSFRNRIDRLFDKVQQQCIERKDIAVSEKRAFEWALTSTADYALQYTLWFYLDKLPTTKVTASVRKHFVGTRYKVNEIVYYQSVVEQIELATPMLNHVSLKPTSITDHNNQRTLPFETFAKQQQAGSDFN